MSFLSKFFVKTQEAEQPEPAYLSKDAVLIDVRSPSEYASGFVEGAINIPLDVVAVKIEAALPNKQSPVILYCRAGTRASSALQMMKSMGYTNLTNGKSPGNVAILLNRAICRR